MNYRLALALLLLLASQLESVAAVAVSEAVKASIRQRVDYGYNPGVAVGIVNAEGRAFYGYGAREFGSAEPIADDTLFEIGSVTKIFTTTLLAALIETADAALTNRLQDYLPPEVTVPTRGGLHITLLHLATHSSGLPYVPPNLSLEHLDNVFADYTEEKLYEFLNTYALPRNPGSLYEYSNVGVGVLGHALALRAGLPYEGILRERILDPLGLNDTRIHLSAGQLSRRVTGYSGVVARPPFRMASLDPAGTLVSTVSDLLTFLEFQSGLRASGLAPAMAKAATIRRPTDIAGVSLGLGWLILPISGDTIIFHNGATFGQTAFIGYRKTSKTAVAVLTNARINQYADVQDIGLSILGFGSLTTIAKPAAVPVELARKYQGLYTTSDGSYFDIRLTNNFLTFSYSNASNYFSTLYPQSARQFNVLDIGVNAFALFNTNASGRVTSMVWNQNGVPLSLTRQTAPSQLAIDPTLQLTLEGDSQINYRLEGSADFLEWRAFATNSIWTNRTAIPTPAEAFQFFRAVAP